MARIAGIMAAKRAAELIPLCHPLAAGARYHLELELNQAESTVEIEATVKTSGKTGVEMEALTAVSVAALTIYDMAKAVDRGMRISDIRLLEKRGGARGDYLAKDRSVNASQVTLLRDTARCRRRASTDARAGRLCHHDRAPESVELSERYPAAADNLQVALAAINEEFAADEERLSDGDEVAFFPPVSGGAASSRPEIFRLPREPFDHDELVAAITTEGAGAVCIFTGAVRGRTAREGHLPRTEHLEYEAYEPMALAKMRQVAAEIRERWHKRGRHRHRAADRLAQSGRQYGALRLLIAASR